MNKWFAVIILAVAQFVMVLDSTVMNVSISQVVKDLNTSVGSLQSAIAFYTLTMASLMLIGAKICGKLGLLKAFIIGSIIYGVGSFVTAISSNISQLFIGWSVVEGIGAVLVIPAIAALIASNYQGTDRVKAYALIGGISGAAAAAGPLIGGFLTTYASWRYVFVAETIIMVFVIILSRKLASSKPTASKIDILSAGYSALGMILIVLGMLQSKTWGWIRPIEQPALFGHEIAPLGISMVAYLLLAGLIVLKLFYNRQLKLAEQNKEPLLRVEMLSIKQLRSGLSVLLSQYFITAAIFFVVPVYLQIVLGLNAFDTGLKIAPLSVALILFSIVGSRLINRYSPRKIIRLGQLLLTGGVLFLLVSIDTELASVPFMMAMFIVGAGLGLLASQLGNVNISAVPEKQSNEIGGLQGTSQNLGSSLGTALIGSIMVVSLTTGFRDSIMASSLPSTTKDYINNNVKSAQIVSTKQAYGYAIDNGASQNQAKEISEIYGQSQLDSLKTSVFILFVASILVMGLSRNIPNKKLES